MSEVTPKGKLRFSLTARFIRPESIDSPEPEDIEIMAYKGHE